MKNLLSISLLWVTYMSDATDLSSECQGMKEFIPYKAGVQAEKKNLPVEAFLIWCNLALKGDYRAQFKLANYYFNGSPNVIEPDPEFAYVWAMLSNYYAVSKKKTEYAEMIYTFISPENVESLNLKLERALKIIPTGNRIDIQHAPIDYDKLFKEFKERSKKKQFTGSRIRRDKPILSTRIFDYN